MDSYGQLGDEWVVDIIDHHVESDPIEDESVGKTEAFFQHGVDHRKSDVTIVQVGVLKENWLAVDAFNLCDLKLQTSMAGMFATGFDTNEIVTLMRDVLNIEQSKREDTLRRLKIMGAVAAENFNEIHEKKK